jgi:AcrR family transcriptional regulator
MERSKKECILSAAVRAFARFGFKKTSVDQIAKDAGVAKGTVYLAADTKEDLFYQAVHREVRAYTAEIAKLIDPRKPADQLLAEATLSGIKYMDERPLVRDLIFGNHQLILPEWAERLDELRALGRQNCVEIVRLGIRQGVFRSDLDVDELANILEDMAIATQVFHNRGSNKEERLRKRLTTAFDLLMNGIRSGRHATNETNRTQGAETPGAAKIEIPRA